jgi:hypothetical protein
MTREPCEKCGVPYGIADWPFCKGGHGRYRGGVERDEIPGGFVQENFGHEPETFYSWSEMRKRADQLGLQPFVKRLEATREIIGGGSQWLKDAEVLATRNGAAPTEDLTWHSFESSVRVIKSLSEVA